MQNGLVKVDFYTKSLHRNFAREVINVGNSEQNQKLVKLSKTYKSPSFYPRKFEEWPDRFEVSLLEDNVLSVKRVDNPKIGWGANLLVDVEYEARTSTETDSSKPSKIPKVIYQTFKSRSVPIGMNEAVNSWKDANSSYEHYFYDDEESLSFIKNFYGKEVSDAYLSLIPGAFKADLWRCCILFERGGVYIDSDMICLKPLDDFLDPDDEFVVSRDDPMSKSFLYNAFIACTPKHKFLEKQIESIVYNVKNKVEAYYLDIAGPGLLGKSVNSCLSRDKNHKYDLGRQDVNGFKLKILMHDWECRSIVSGDDKLIYTEYSNKSKEMDSLKIPTYYSLYTKGVVYQRIPRKVYFTTEDNLLINGYMVESFKEKNKNWSVEHYTPQRRLSFFKKHRNDFLRLLGVDVFARYESLRTNVEKADFWRYCVIYLNGGVYTDSDTYCSKPLDEWVLSHDLILGIEANLQVDIAKILGMDLFGKFVGQDKVVSVCNWSFAAEPRHEFFKNIILDICNNEADSEGVIINTGPGRFTKHAAEYFKDCDFSSLDNGDITKGNSVLFSINRFGSNQNHSGSHKQADPLDVSSEEIYIVHLFEGYWRSIPHKKINVYKSSLGVSHNMSIRKSSDGYFGIARLDKDTSRTVFLKKIGDCRSLLELRFDDGLGLLSEVEKPITGFGSVAKFEDFRLFSFGGKQFSSVSYIDNEFNTRVAILNNNHSYLGDVNINQALSKSPFSEGRVWEKNWLFFEHANELYFIYSTIPRYVVFKCHDFNSLSFNKHIDTPWSLDMIPKREFYCTSNVLVGGSTNPIFLKDKNVYLYFVHTKLYNERKYNHYAVVTDHNLQPIKLCKKPILSKYLEYGLFFVMSVVQQGDYLVFSGGLEDNTNFVWELSKQKVFNTIGI